jgi:nucleoside-diphosphate-sugar epimerase
MRVLVTGGAGFVGSHVVEGALSAGFEVSTLALANQITALCGSRSSVQQGGVRAGDLERSLLDVTTFTQVLGTPTALGEGLSATAQWYRER